MSSVSTKELHFLEEFLSWELYMAKTCHRYSSQFSDRNWGALIDEAGRVHQQNFQDLYRYLAQLQ